MLSNPDCSDSLSRPLREVLGESQSCLTHCSCPFTCGVPQLAAWGFTASKSFHLILFLDNPGSSCSAGLPLTREGFSCGHGQAARGLVLAGVVCSESSACFPHPLSFHLEESRQRRGRGTVAERVPELLGTASPGPGGTASASSSSQSLQSPPLGTCGICVPGMLCFPAPLQVLLIAARGDSQRWELFSGC